MSDNLPTEQLTYVGFRTEQRELAEQIKALVTPFCRKYNLIPQELTFEWDYYGVCRVKVNA